MNMMERPSINQCKLARAITRGNASDEQIYITKKHVSE